MRSYLLNRNGNYHLRIGVPSDLTGVISSVELVKSLKTKNKKEARLVALPYQQSVSKTFSLLRSGFIPVSKRKNQLIVKPKETSASPFLTAPVTPSPQRNPYSFSRLSCSCCPASSSAEVICCFVTLRSKYIVSALRQKSYFYFIFQYDEAAGSIDKRPLPGKI